MTPAIKVSAAGESPLSGITVSPPSQQIVIGSGLLQAYTDIKITNNTDHVFDGTIKLLDFSALNQNGGVSLEQAGTKFGLADWMSLPGNNKVSLAKGQTTDLKITIDNRSDLSPGGHYGAVAITSSSANNSGNNNVSFNQQLVSLIFLNKSGGDVYGLKLYDIRPGQWSGGLPEEITLGFQATGNVYVVPHGYVEVFDPHGAMVEHGVINPQATLVMQGSSRQYTTSLDQISRPIYHGRYKIEIHYRHDDQQGFQTATYYFDYKSPHTVLLYLSAAVILLIGSALVLNRKKFRRTHKYRAQ